MGPQEPPARRCVSLAAGTPRRAGPPYGLPAQADALRGQFWTPIEGQYSTPIDSQAIDCKIEAGQLMERTGENGDPLAAGRGVGSGHRLGNIKRTYRSVEFAEAGCRASAHNPAPTVWPTPRPAAPRRRLVSGRRLHDLWRTARSHWSAIPGFTDTVRELMLAHVQPGIRAVYDQFKYSEQKRDLLTAWEARLGGIIDPPSAVSNVVALPPARIAHRPLKPKLARRPLPKAGQARIRVGGRGVCCVRAFVPVKIPLAVAPG